MLWNTAGRDLISIAGLTKEEILAFILLAKQMKQGFFPRLLEGVLMGSCFFEPSTRTRLSFESAVARLGGQTVGFSDSLNTSIKKGESLSDTLRMMENYVDILVIRHPLEGSAQLAANLLQIPVINAGDGAHEHPTQTLLDLFTIHERHGTLENLHIALAGDLKNGRTVHSLIEGLSHFNTRLYFISPAGLEMPKESCNLLRTKGIKFTFHDTLTEVLPKLDILYMTRIQKERFPNPEAFEEIKAELSVDTEMVSKAKATLGIMHPLPRNHEIAADVDRLPQALYFLQAGNGVCMRQAILAALMGRLEKVENTLHALIGENR